MSSLFLQSRIKITSFHKKPVNDFLKHLKLFLKKNRVSVENKDIITLNKTKIKKETILRSPHVNKKARDQIEIKHITNIFYIDNFFNWKHFFFYLNTRSSTVVKVEYNYHYSQLIFYKKIHEQI